MLAPTPINMLNAMKDIGVCAEYSASYHDDLSCPLSRHCHLPASCKQALGLPVSVKMEHSSSAEKMFQHNAQ
jgi:hypothetical protein